ncbi:MAG: hypothetical protein KUA37_06280 [Desulfomicrobium sp.]|nr:hypothetical protein [Desulfomicrobium sp.]
MRRFGSEAIEPPEPNSAIVKIKKKKNEISEKQRVIELVRTCIYAELRNEKLPVIPRKMPSYIKEKINKVGGLSIWFRQQKDYSSLKTKISSKISKKSKLNQNPKDNNKSQIEDAYLSESDYEAEIARRREFIKEALESIQHNELVIKTMENEILQRKIEKEKDNN